MTDAAPAPTRPLWKRGPATPEALTARLGDTLSGLLGMRVTEVGPDVLRAEMPVDARHVQPWRILHGGANVALAETLGSMAGVLASPEGTRIVGLEVNANHLAPVPEGDGVTAECRPVHVGRTTQVWAIEVRRASDGRLSCVSRLTCAVIEDRTPAREG